MIGRISRLAISVSTSPARDIDLQLIGSCSLVAALDSLDLHDQSMLAWAQVVQMTTMLRLFEEDVSSRTLTVVVLGCLLTSDPFLPFNSTISGSVSGQRTGVDSRTTTIAEVIGPDRC